MVTLEGEMLVPGGAISGGAFKNNSNLLGRRRELGELKQKLSAAKEKLNIAMVDIENNKTERNHFRKANEEKKEELQEFFLKKNTPIMNVLYD